MPGRPTTSFPTRLGRSARLLSHLFLGLYVLAFRYPRLSHAARAAINQRWSAQLIRILGMKVRVLGKAPGLLAHNTLLVANHVSWLDIFALNSVTVSHFVAKRELRRWPVIGWMIKNAGTVFIDRTSRRDASRVNEQLAHSLSQGSCMAVFPEGTTTDGTDLLPFKASLFESARMAGSHVQPVALRYLDEHGRLTTLPAYIDKISLVRSLGRILSMPSGTVELVFGQTLQAHAEEECSRFQLAEAARAEVASGLGLTPPAPAQPRKPTRTPDDLPA
ncbi:lysophospholipid acyltransferase family protein [Crenobacter sp. SG2303]|uniref:1-acyl-sn-glycerol-3-phosphate acyltransferase n=1 Tax=Crenobacter oryzisoli TaxID=3056844 RepID=A0ABT7XS50_9NEIS|nr:MULTISPECIES: lysophospholipid acyltransferase family protein [unclassified Crenobacter]MDN0076623.1 lysophospholipid acyltransferase family protein [Crenobacter sp. SG2303]MDN0082120.1 lysophospholipid acyltransferase family protein [Crenobacter sp. SG2305]